MDLEHERDVCARPGDRAAVVVQPRAVGRADVDEPRARLLHDVGNAKPATDLDALTSAHWHLAPGGQSRQDEQHCGSVVVDDHRGLGVAQPRQQRADPSLARASLAGRQVELERLGARDRRERHRSSSEVRVQQDPGRVDHCRQQRPAQGHRARRGVLDGTISNGLPGDVDEQRVRQARRSQRSRQRIDGWRPRHRRRG